MHSDKIHVFLEIIFHNNKNFCYFFFTSESSKGAVDSKPLFIIYFVQ